MAREGENMLRWSENVKNAAPMLLAPEEVGSLRDRAYPFANTGTNPDAFILVTDDGVFFKGQRGPIKDVGVNGCQVDDLITFVIGTLQVFNKKFSCRQNSLAITKLEEALHWLEDRRLEREGRGVEGRDKE
jgi:hypothetical protein